MSEYNKAIPTLAEVKQKEREEIEHQKNIEAKEFLLKVLIYYELNYPTSKLKIEWKIPKVSIKIGKEDLDIELGKKSEIELNAIRTALEYYHDERQMPSPLEHDKKNRINQKIHALIPGDLYAKKLEKLREEKKRIEDEIEKLEKQSVKDKEIFEKKVEKNLEQKELVCDICKEFKAKTPAGLANHRKKCENERRKEPLLNL